MQPVCYGSSSQNNESEPQIRKWGLISLETICLPKETPNERQAQPSEQEERFADKDTHKEFISKHTNSSCNPASKTNTTQEKNGPKIEMDISPRKAYKLQLGAWKDAQHH